MSLVVHLSINLNHCFATEAAWLRLGKDIFLALSYHGNVPATSWFKMAKSLPWRVPLITCFTFFIKIWCLEAITTQTRFRRSLFDVKVQALVLKVVTNPAAEDFCWFLINSEKKQLETSFVYSYNMMPILFLKCLLNWNGVTQPYRSHQQMYTLPGTAWSMMLRAIPQYLLCYCVISCCVVLMKVLFLSFLYVYVQIAHEKLKMCSHDIQNVAKVTNFLYVIPPEHNTVYSSGFIVMNEPVQQPCYLSQILNFLSSSMPFTEPLNYLHTCCVLHVYYKCICGAVLHMSVLSFFANTVMLLNPGFLQ